MRIVFTCGVFDTFHGGHRYFLNECKSRGDYLVVAVNTDASTRNLKGNERPRDTLALRMGHVRFYCDAAIPFNGNPFALIEAIKPDVYVKGDDWEEKAIIGANFVRSYGGSVVRIKRLPDISTSAILAQTRRSNA